VPYEKSKRAAGKSKWNLRRKLAAFADAFVGFSYAPLRLMSYLGLVCSTIGMCYAMVVVGIRLSGSEPIPGWASLMVVLLVIGGVQMTMLGVVGEYLWRTLEESRRRPLYHLESWEGFEEERVFPHGSRAAESRSSS
jgi:dolichol-phosphate mannosyltransferase